MSTHLQIWPVEGIGEILSGDDLSVVIGDAIAAGASLEAGDIVVVTSKIVSKAEGRFVEAADREQAITDETVRLVATREHPGGTTRIVENPLGLVLAAAGVDASNTPEGMVLLLPVDPDASARIIRAALEQRFGVQLGVLVTDTIGRPWRQGQVDIAIGAAGIRVVDDLRGTQDAGGRPLEATIVAIADELASAADLVTGKASNLPVAIVRGLAGYAGGDGAGRDLIRPAAEDMFSLGTAEAIEQGRQAGWAEGYEAAKRETSNESASSQLVDPSV